VTVTHLTAIVFMYKKYQPEGGWITGQKMLVKIF